MIRLLQRHLADRGIETLVHYPVPLPEQPAFSRFAPADCPVARSVCRDIVSLPLHPRLTDQEVAEVASAVLEGLALCGH